MITVSMSDRDWGRVSGAIEHALGFERRIASEVRGTYNSLVSVMTIELRIANLARIKQSLARQRKEARNA